MFQRLSISSHLFCTCLARQTAEEWIRTIFYMFLGIFVILCVAYFICVAERKGFLTASEILLNPERVCDMISLFVTTICQSKTSTTFFVGIGKKMFENSFQCYWNEAFNFEWTIRHWLGKMTARLHHHVNHCWMHL